MGHAAELGSVVQKLINLSAGKNLLDDPPINAINLSQLYKFLAKEKIKIKQPQDLEKLFFKKHPRVLEWLDKTVQFLTPTVLILEDMFDPQAIIFGGRLPVPLLDYLLEKLQAKLPARLIAGVPRQCRFEHSQIVWDAACLGAASLPFFEAIAPNHNALLKRV